MLDRYNINKVLVSDHTCWILASGRTRCHDNQLWRDNKKVEVKILWPVFLERHRYGYRLTQYLSLKFSKTAPYNFAMIGHSLYLQFL